MLVPRTVAMTGNAEGACRRIAGYVCLSCWPSRSKCSGLVCNPERVCLQTAFLNEVRPNRRNMRLRTAQRAGRCVDRVGAEDEIVLVRDGRAENKFSVGPRLELDRFARRLESPQVAMPQLVGNRYGAGRDGGPQDGVARRGLVAPALAGLQADRKIVDRRGGYDGARCGSMAAEEDARWTVFRHIFRGLVDA